MRPHTVLARAASIECTDYVRNWGICRRTAREAPTTDYSNRIGAGHAHRRENASGFLIGWLPFAHLGVLTKTQRQQLFLEEFLRRTRETSAGERVCMAVGDLFEAAEVYDLNKVRTARRDDRDES
jgi:hypothetical protein